GRVLAQSYVRAAVGDAGDRLGNQIHGAGGRAEISEALVVNHRAVQDGALALVARLLRAAPATGGGDAGAEAHVAAELGEAGAIGHAKGGLINAAIIQKLAVVTVVPRAAGQGENRCSGERDHASGERK